MATVVPDLSDGQSGIFTPNEANYLKGLFDVAGILPQTLGLTNGRDEVGLGYGICDSLSTASASDVDAGIKRHWPNLTQLQVNALIGEAVAAFCEQNAGKLS